MGKATAENLQNSPDSEALNTEEIIKNNVDFSLVKIEVEEKSKEKDSGLDERSPVWVEPDSLTISVESDSESMGYTIFSDSSELSYSDCAESLPLTVVPISFIEPEDFKESDEKTMPIRHMPLKMVGVGMCNLGNTCFLNAVVQCFMHNVVLLQLLASFDHVSPCDTHLTGFCVVCMIRQIVDLSMSGVSDNVTPKKIFSHLRDFSLTFRPNQQEDAHEFLQCFLNKLEICCYNLKPRNNIVKEAFGGRLVSMLRCFNCCHLSVTHEPLIDLSLEIVDVDSVPKALESFTKIEKIEFSCEKCKTQGPFEKQLLIDRAPSVATLCLKRFNNDGFVVQKVDKHVSFPLELDMFHYTNKINNEEMKYDLYAVIVHSGFSISSGHYYSFIRCNPNEWYKFNDEQVHWVHKDHVLAEQAYILFYAKRGTLWFSDYRQIHKPFVNLVTPSTSSCIPNNHASDVGESNHAADDTSPKPTPNKRIKGDY
ncbi:ubiquitin carboxyl-terminal hydrolase 20-like [Solanum verrucosum]|uniref:ubiquitin carboxyl-terminal hydrolase 20-like n=1 Tax=Solanum verrucosum TaxID=315347 RepID=UPI0020D15CFB|nr:ubiquitin carboxyl-terminal hydrolase 20-like [Solanum verrucosum]